MKKYLKYLQRLFSLALLVLSLGATAQTGVDVSNSTNYGSASWGVGMAPNSFNVSGPYDATTNSATDYFYDATGSGTPGEISGNTAPGFHDLVFANGASSPMLISNTAGIDVNGTLQLQNGITTSSSSSVAGAIRLGAAATTAGSSAFGPTRYVDGYMSKAGSTPFTYPLGDAGIYSPVTMSNPAGTTVRYEVGNPGSTNIKATQGGGLQLATVSQFESYPISPVNGSAPAGSTLTIPYTNFPGVTDPSTLTIAGWDGTQWVNLSISPINTINGSTVTVTLAFSLAGFTKFTLASTSPLNPLPIEFVSFSGNVVNCNAVLAWKTATEQNSNYYAIEHSTDGSIYTEVGRVASLNNINGGSYSFTYTNLVKGNNYFRIRAVDFNTNSKLSTIVPLSSNCGGTIITVTPNPAVDVIKITGAPAKAMIAIINAAGQQMIMVMATGNAQTIDVRKFARGTYFISIYKEDGTTAMETKKFVKQ